MSSPVEYLSLQDWAALPEDGSHRYELVEGVLRVSPKATSRHQLAIMELGWRIRAQSPDEFAVLPEAELVLAGGDRPSVRIPDLMVVPRASARAGLSRLSPVDVLLVVEVLSPGTRRTDLVDKHAEYAAARIGHYWVVDVEPPVSLTVFGLAGGQYELSWEGSGVARFESPFPLEIDLNSL